MEMYWHNGDFVLHPESEEERELLGKIYEALDGARISKRPTLKYFNSVEGDD